MDEKEIPTGPPFTIERYGSFGACIHAERDWLLAQNNGLRNKLRTVAALFDREYARQLLGDDVIASGTHDVSKLQTDLELLQASVNRIMSGAVRDVLRLLATEEISVAKAHEWIRDFVIDGKRGPLPDLSELSACYGRAGLEAFIAKHFPDSYLASKPREKTPVLCPSGHPAEPLDLDVARCTVCGWMGHFELGTPQGEAGDRAGPRVSPNYEMSDDLG